MASNRIALQCSRQHLRSLQSVSVNGVSANHGVRPDPEAVLHRKGALATEHLIQTQQRGATLCGQRRL